MFIAPKKAVPALHRGIGVVDPAISSRSISSECSIAGKEQQLFNPALGHE